MVQYLTENKKGANQTQTLKTSDPLIDKFTHSY
jgi:hypothetical protein